MKWLKLGQKLFPLIIGAIHAVEFLAKGIHGKEKQDAAIETIGAMIGTLELTLDKDIMDQEEFKVLLRRFMDDYVAIQNFIGKPQQTSTEEKS